MSLSEYTRVGALPALLWDGGGGETPDLASEASYPWGGFSSVQARNMWADVHTDGSWL